jgi:hypothetical protein
MSALANVFFKDLFTEIDPGLLPQSLAIGTTSGSAIQLGGVVPFDKLLFDLVFGAGSVAGSVSMYLETATASGATFTSISQTLVSTVTTLSLSAQYDLKIDTRLIAFCNLATAPLWVHVVVIVTGAAIPMAMKVLGWEAGFDPVNVMITSTKPVTGYTAFY